LNTLTNPFASDMQHAEDGDCQTLKTEICMCIRTSG